MSLKAGKGLKERSREQCKAQTKAGGVVVYARRPLWNEGCASFMRPGGL
jgi:hypothetical protein